MKVEKITNSAVGEYVNTLNGKAEDKYPSIFIKKPEDSTIDNDFILKNVYYSN